MVLHQELRSNPQIYVDDLVYSKNTPVPRFGLVASVSWDEEYSSDEDDDDDDEESYEEVEEDEEEEETEVDSESSPQVTENSGETGTQDDKETISVMWFPNFEETYVEASEVSVKDRALMHDGIVALANAPLGQTGVVVAVTIKATLLFPDRELLEVDTSHLSPIHPYLEDVRVVRDGWLGRVVRCAVDVIIQFEDGSKCRVSNADPKDLPLPDATYTVEDIWYYPSLVLQVPPRTLKKAKFLVGKRGVIKKNKGRQGIVVEVIPTFAEVEWMLTGFAGNEGLSNPPRMNPVSSLTILNVHAASDWTIGDHAFCPAELRQHNPEMQLPENNNNKKKPFQALANNINCATVVHTQTCVSVCWQDGTTSQSIRATQLVPVQHMLHADFWPEDFVLEREVEGESLGKKRVGVVKRVLAEARTCEVMWLANEEEETEKEQAQTEEEEKQIEEVSLYAIEGHQDANFRLGCYVLRLNFKETTTTTDSTSTTSSGVNDAPSSSSVSTSSPSTQSPSNDTEENDIPDLQSSSSEEEGESDEEYVTDSDDNENKSEVVQKKVGPWVGQVINIKDGVITVEWVDGTISTAKPHELFRVIDEDDSDSSDDEYDDEYDEDEDEEEAPQLIGADEATDTAQTGSSFLEQAASIFDSFSRARWWAEDVSSAIGNLSDFIGMGNQTTPASTSDNPETSPTTSTISSPSESSPSSSSSVPPPSVSDSSAASSSVFSSSSSSSSKSSSLYDLGPKFSVLSNSQGHHYSNLPAVLVSKFLKRVQQEWELLRNNLPDGIFVRVYEDRMDLMSILYIGPSGTPYQNAVFLFDLYLPATYPNVAPQIFYYCVGEQLNPNLYKDGNVCLSLLGTWNGRGTEMWQPASSNVLQVVLSVQGLILGTAHPYFLEAGYEKQKYTTVGMHNARIYNEMVYLVTVQSIIYNARSPPSPFEEIVKNHFTTNGKVLVNKCRAHLEDNKNNNSTNDNNNNNNNNNNDDTNVDDTAVFLACPSVGFKKSLASLVVKLEIALQVYNSAM